MINKNILIIEDNSHIRRVVELKLRKAGYQVLIAKNGEEGLNLIKSQHPDVVITDIAMPKLDGKTVCIKANEFKKEWPFLTLIVSCSLTFDEKKWINTMKDTQFMEKPFSPNKVLQCVDQYLGIER